MLLLYFWPPWKYQRLKRFLMFSGGMEETSAMKWVTLIRYSRRWRFYLNHFCPRFPSYTQWKHQRTFGFLIFSGIYKVKNLARSGTWRASHSNYSTLFTRHLTCNLNVSPNFLKKKYSHFPLEKSVSLNILYLSPK